jgi:CRISPR-associated endonuclease/helicase Cas3
MTLHNSDAWDVHLAKQKRQLAARSHQRKHFRHELASALAMLVTGDSDLAAYLVAAHHGKVRLAVRSMPGECRAGLYRVRGIEDGDALPGAEIGSGCTVPPVALPLEPLTLGMGNNGGPSWVERVIHLRNRLGPFRLAFLEALLRAADECASADPGDGAEYD